MHFAKYHHIDTLNWFIGISGSDNQLDKLPSKLIDEARDLLSESVSERAVLASISNYHTAFGSSETALGSQITQLTLSENSTVLNFQLHQIDLTSVGVYLLQTLQPNAKSANSDDPQSRIESYNHQIISLDNQKDFNEIYVALMSAFPDDLQLFDTLASMMSQLNSSLISNFGTDSDLRAVMMFQPNWI